ncbi:glycoside hydrolase family 3 protein [Gloeothece verrucosa]|uniref:beta-N-acetylhexosaminidase n=1 Tax=Gloeothece verrucosa (strain PCC 7822) TaxID=497965 RepID=E0UBC6_GLOV7|nr:glycoside hydrolase family 3 N-terminal domain-containing protein [Gloeothece verrucosa]ADN12758.1 glycoside hydrolase family 3 domain protein [Gloeothece verrucosa PCC 7822]
MKDCSEFSLKQQIGQMVVVRASGYLFDHQRLYPQWEATNEQLRHWLETLNLGGVIFVGGSAAELALRTQQLQNWATTPLLMAADLEEGVGQRFSAATQFPPIMALGEIAKENLSMAQSLAAKMGAITAAQAHEIGINWILAPVVDVNNNPHNPVINVRSFGDQPEQVSKLATAFIEGTQNYPVLTCAKHFPGHGNTATDSHLDLPVLPHSQEDLEKTELPPFKEVIAFGVDSIMSAHLLIPAWDQENPATLSRAILTEQLREKLGFKGIIVTDALIMGGVTKYASPAEIAVKAVEAGADILLMPDDPLVAIEAVYQAVQSGRISPERIAQSVQRIIEAKEKLKLGDRVRRDELPLQGLLQPSSRETVKSILQASLQTGGNFPLEPLQGNSARNLIVVDDLLNRDFLDRQSPAVVLPKQFGYDLQLFDQNTLAFAGAYHRLTLLQVFIRGNPFRGSAGLTDIAANFYQHLLEKRLIQGLIIYGSPYVLEWFRDQLAGELPWVFSYGQMPMAQEMACQALFGVAQGNERSKEFTD